MQAAARGIAALLALLLFAGTAQAQVSVSFHSFKGSVFFGRYPHTFVVFEGTLDATGEAVNENYGFSAKKVGLSILNGPVEHAIYSEEPKYIHETRRHFTIAVSDATYWRMKAEVAAWRNAPGKFYDLDTRNCIHFAGRIAELAGVRVDYPHKLLRKPRAWLEHITALNPWLPGR